MTKLSIYCVTNKRIKFLENCTYNLAFIHASAREPSHTHSMQRTARADHAASSATGLSDRGGVHAQGRASDSGLGGYFLTRFI